MRQRSMLNSRGIYAQHWKKFFIKVEINYPRRSFLCFLRHEIDPGWIYSQFTTSNCLTIKSENMAPRLLLDFKFPDFSIQWSPNAAIKDLTYHSRIFPQWQINMAVVKPKTLASNCVKKLEKFRYRISCTPLRSVEPTHEWARGWWRTGPRKEI